MSACVRTYGNTSCDRVLIQHLPLFYGFKFLIYLTKFVHYSNFSAFWRDMVVPGMKF